jgi:transcription elongation GreA/GreB family factor
MQNASLKQKLLVSCIEYVESRINSATTAMQDAQNAANEEGKSSAGDKYETSRAMMQIERDQAAVQLDEAMKLKRTLNQINANEHHNVVSLGSIVTTNSFRAFVAVGPPKLKVDGNEYFIITPMSPLGKVLIGLKAGADFTFNNKQNVVVEIS